MPQELNIRTAQTDIAQPVKPILPKPIPLSLQKVRWFVIELDSGKLIALDAKNYENLAKNIAELIRYIQDANSQLNYYTENNHE